MNSRLKTSISLGLIIGIVLSAAFNIFGLESILVGSLCGLLITIAGFLLQSENESAKASREIEITQAKIDVLEELKNETST